MIQQRSYPSRDPVYPFDNIGKLLVDLARHFQSRALEKLRQRGHPRVRTSHGTVIGNLGLDTLRLTELAQRGGITQQAMGKLIKELERIGYVRRTLDPSDRRARQIQLTERGIGLLQDLETVFAEVRIEYAGAIGATELDRMEQQLRTAKVSLGIASSSAIGTIPAAPAPLLAAAGSTSVAAPAQATHPNPVGRATAQHR